MNKKIYNFFKPTLIECAFMGVESFYFSPSLFLITHNITQNWKLSLINSITPQILTYLIGRTYELFGKESYTKNIFKSLKFPMKNSLENKLNDQ